MSSCQKVIDRNHVLLFNNAPIKDADVPALASSAENWGRVAAAVPGMQPEMVFLADLQLKAEWLLVEELNPLLAESGLAGVEYVSEAVTRLGNNYLSTREHEETQKVLVEFFSTKTGSSEDALAVIREWPMVQAWRRKRVAFSHPLVDNQIDGAKLQSFKSQVLQAQPYAPVRTAARVLIGAAEALLQETPSQVV